MNTATIGRLASATLVTGVATLALAAPASAIRMPPPGYDPNPSSTVPQSDQGWELAQVATGAAGGLVLAGAGAGAVIVVRRHRGHAAHPA
ncbi:MAG: hypothetical protein ACXVXB_15195 [Nocardioidaceae bacterium]